MMLRVRTFLVEALLLTVTSAQRCSVCGDGYKVGRPAGSTSICFPKLSDSTCTCHDLELAGLHGLIPIVDCPTLPQMISETCFCQETNSVQNTDESTNSLQGSGYSTHRSVKSWFSSSAPVSLPPVALESFYPSVAASSPVVAPYYYPTADSFRPAKTTSPSATTPAGPQFSPFMIIQWLICISLVLGFSYFVYIFAEPICWEHCRCFGARMLQNSSAIPVGASPMLSNTDASGRRPFVLEVMFPNEGFHQIERAGNPEQGYAMKYDPQLRQYVFSEDTTQGDISCSICMELLVPEDVIVISSCLHAYHRECIMNWLQEGHDECPNCRQPMWDPETYNLIDRCLVRASLLYPRE